jgi:26S proteasome regulatory subunit N2
VSGEESIRLYHDFLQRNNRVDLLILKNTKVGITLYIQSYSLIWLQEGLDSRSSIYHTALTLQNAYMHSGTSSDVFLRENLDWLGRAANWSKFSATAALGVIHKGNVSEGMKLLGPYLPSDTGAGGPGSSTFSEGGALYALGLINAGRGKDVIGYLREKLKAATDETVQHGAALGLGVAGMGTADMGERRVYSAAIVN